MAKRRVPYNASIDETLPSETRPLPPKREINTYPRDDNAQLAPFPIGDQSPRVMGSEVTLEYISTIFRWGMEGQRRDYVDLLNELLERDPHSYGVLFQRMLGAISGRMEISPPNNVPKKYRKRAGLLAKFVSTRVDRICKFKGSLLQLLFQSNYYGIGCQEITWGQEKDTGFTVPMRLHMVHSRRIEYPFFDSWDPYIVDNSLGGIADKNWGTGAARGQNVRRHGIRIDDFYGKFILHVASLRADYPTREGLGRQIAFWLCLKGMAARSGALLIERFAIPFALAYLNTVADEKHPRPATERDMQVAQAVLTALASGRTAKGLLPDSVKLEFEQVISSSGKMPTLEFLRYIDAQIAKAVVGTSELSDDDTSGNKGRAEVVQDFILSLLQYDADMLAESIQECLINPIIQYNFPEDIALTPKFKFIVERSPSFEQLYFHAQSAEIMKNLGGTLDLGNLADRLLMKLAESSEKKSSTVAEDEELSTNIATEAQIKVEKAKPKIQNNSTKKLSHYIIL